MNVMSPNHPRWDEFVDRLIVALGPPPGACNHFGPGVHSSFENARPVLANMGMDVEASLNTFCAAGAHCDCFAVALAFDAL